MNRRSLNSWCAAAAALLAVACGGGEEDSGGHPSGSGGPSGRGEMMGGPPGEALQTAVPVEASPVERRSISSFIETNGTLEAENEVDIVARASGPIVQLEAEETMTVSRDQLLARIDPSEIAAQLEISKVALDEARLAFDRAERLKSEELVSQEAYEDARATFESAQAQFDGDEIELGYTEIRAPFSGLIINRYIKFAQNVSPGDALFRISDFDPLLCPIQVPERNIPLLAKGQRAYLEVEAWPEERFEARVLRLSPVVDAATGTVRVTLEVSGRGRLRPGMFASVYLETATHEDALVIPKNALALESIGDTVYVAGEGVAIRREVELGFSERDRVEVLSGLEEGELIVTVGQDGLSDGTPIQVLGSAAEGATVPRASGAAPGEAPAAASPPSAGAGGPPGAPSGSGFPGGRPDLSQMTPEQIERMKERMRSMGMTDEQIDKRLEQLREGQGGEGG